MSRAGMFRLWRQLKGADCLTILSYHGVLPSGYRSDDLWLDGNLVCAEQFHDHVKTLKSHYAFISPEDFLAFLKGDVTLPPKTILLTCDDGLLNNVTDMLPVLKSEGLSCLFFLSGMSLKSKAPLLWHEEVYLLLKAGQGRRIRIPLLGKGSFLLANKVTLRKLCKLLIDALSRYDYPKREDLIEKLRDGIGLPEDWRRTHFCKEDMRRRFQLLSLQEVKALIEEGMTVGSHTCTHPVLSRLGNESVRKEIEESRRLFEKTLGISVWALAYPFGDESSITQREAQYAQRAGYTCAMVNFGSLYATDRDNRFLIPRIHITSEMTSAEVEAYVSGFHSTLKGLMLKQ